MTMQSDIGLIGLAVMGENLALNMESKGFSVAVFNRTTEVTEKFAASRGKGKKIRRARTMEEFIGALKSPRKAMIMVKAGEPVDAVIGEVVPLLEKGDVIIDGGNSLFTDTQRRFHDLEGKGIHYIGCGVSGGEEGALKGPSLMPGGSREALGNDCARFSERSRPRSMASPAVATWGRTAPGTTSRWSTTASNTATCS